MRFVRVTPAGAAVAVFDIGGPARGGQATLYLGGLGSASSAAFAGVIGHPALAGRGRALTVDLVGSGWSDHDDDFGHTIDEHAGCVAAVLDAAGSGPVAVVGHSLGGSVAISLAAQRPELVTRLVVAEPNLDPGVGSFSAQIAAMDEARFVAGGHERTVQGLLDAGADVFARTVRRWSSRGLHRTAVSLLADRPVTFRAQLASWPGPRTYLSGALSREDLDPIRASGCRVEIVPDAGHVLMADNPDGSAAAVARGLAHL